MKNALQSFIEILCISLIPVIPFSILWYKAKKRGWNPIRILALGITLILMVISILLWISIKDDWILIIGILISLINGMVILALPILSPRIATLLSPGDIKNN
jgi:hypothetical protein